MDFYADVYKRISVIYDIGICICKILQTNTTDTLTSTKLFV